MAPAFFPSWLVLETQPLFQPSVFTPLCLYSSQPLCLEHLPQSAPCFLPASLPLVIQALPKHRLYGEPSEAPPQPLSLI